MSDKKENNKLKKSLQSMKSKYDHIDSKNKKKMIIMWTVFFLVCIGIIIAVIASNSTTKKKTDKDTKKKAKATTEAPNPLQQNTNEDVNTLVTSYISALQNCDVAALKTLDLNCSAYDDMTKYTNQATFVESYNNITCYTKNGPYKRGYVAYVVVDIKFRNINQTCKGMYQYIIRRNNEGKLVIDTSGDMEPSISNKFASIGQSEDVQQLIDMVNQQTQENIAADPALADFVNNTLNKQQTTEAVN